MNLKSFISKFAVLTAGFLLVLTVDLYSQTAQAEKRGAVAAYVSDKDKADAGLLRNRKIESDAVKNVYPSKPTAVEVLEFEKRALALINQKRADNGLPALAWSDELASLARLHSENMVKFNFFSHKGVDGLLVDGRADSLGITRWTAVGENIAYNRGSRNPIETAVEKWMLSPTHRENLLNDGWKETAIGIAVNADGTYYFTQVFIKRR